MSSRAWRFVRSGCSAVLVLLVSFGCSSPREEALAIAPPVDTLVVLKGPEIAQRADSSVVVVEAVTSEGTVLGTAFVVDTLGLLVTNRHVIEGATSVTIRSDLLASPCTARVVFTSSVCDLAVLFIEGLGLPPLCIDREDEAQEGEHVFAIGHPEGLEYSISDGVISAIRHAASAPTMVQHTASISHGSSGGPLLDEFGRVLGMNTLTRVRGQNLNFAIPVDEIRTGVATARAIFVDGVDRQLVEGEAGFRARYPDYAASVELDSTTIADQVRQLSKEGNRETAWELAARGIKAFPMHLDLIYAAEQVAYARGMLKECEILLDGMTQIAPDTAFIHNLRGDLYKERGLYRKAKEEYALCIAMTAPCDFWHRDSRINLAFCSLQMAEPSKGVDEIRPVLDCDNFSDPGGVWAQIALLQFHANALDEADRAARRARQLLPERSEWKSLLDSFKLPRPVFVESREQEFDSYGRLFVKGIVRNQSGDMLTDVEVIAEGFDAQGNVVATGTTKVGAPWLMNDMTGWFRVELEGILDKVIRCDARVVYYK